MDLTLSNGSGFSNDSDVKSPLNTKNDNNNHHNNHNMTSSLMSHDSYVRLNTKRLRKKENQLKLFIFIALFLFILLVLFITLYALKVSESNGDKNDSNCKTKECVQISASKYLKIVMK
jgi:hypothetical protein